MSFKIGHKPWNAGMKGIHLSPSSEFRKEHVAWNKLPTPTCVDCGVKTWRSEAVRCKECFIKFKFQTESNHPRWKGAKTSYRSLHKWVQKHLGKPHYCEICQRDDLPHRSYHWANKSRTYKRIIEDWIRLCASCHKEYDKVII